MPQDAACCADEEAYKADPGRWCCVGGIRTYIHGYHGKLGCALCVNLIVPMQFWSPDHVEGPQTATTEQLRASQQLIQELREEVAELKVQRRSPTTAVE